MVLKHLKALRSVMLALVRNTICILAIVVVTPSATQAGIVLTTLHSFDGTNGYAPVVVLRGADGNFYGTAQYGGLGFTNGLSGGNGTVFRMTPDGIVTNLVWFDSTNGRLPA